MASSSTSSGVSGIRCAPIVEARTDKCLEEMSNMSSDELANVILLIGRTGVGKSALLEYLTNAQGHAKDSPNPVTLNFQLESVKPLGKQYYIMDTPGFDTDKEQDVFKEIIRGIKAVRSYAKIVGVMLVTRINDNRAEAVDNKLLTFVNKLCGPEYAAQITVVTNFWNVSEPEEKVEFETRLGQRLQRWRSVLGQEVKQYHHGRRYNSFGEDVGECLKWRGDSERVKAYAKAMVVRNYEEIDPKDPSIVYELSENRPQGMTAAGEFLGIAPPPQSSSYSSTSASSPGHPEGTTSSSSTPKPEAEEIPKPSASSHRASQSQPQTPKEQNGPSPLSEALVWGLNNFIIPMAKQAITDKLNGRQTGGAFGGAAGGFPSYFDFLSSEDHFKARGLPGDLGYRTQWAQARGITQDPGSSEFGDLVRRAIMRESPLS